MNYEHGKSVAVGIYSSSSTLRRLVSDMALRDLLHPDAPQDVKRGFKDGWNGCISQNYFNQPPEEGFTLGGYGEGQKFVYSLVADSIEYLKSQTIRMRYESMSCSSVLEQLEERIEDVQYNLVRHINSSFNFDNK